MIQSILSGFLRLVEREPYFRFVLLLAVASLIVLSLTGAVDIEWPIVGLVGLLLAIFYFPSVSRLTLPGGLEIHRELDRVQQDVEASRRAERPDDVPADDDDNARARPAEPERAPSRRERLLEIFQVSPNAAAMEMGRLVEETVSNLLMTYGRGTKPLLDPIQKKLAFLLEQQIINGSTAKATLDVWGLRNRAVHEQALSDDDILRFLDIGSNVLDALTGAAMKNWQVSAPRGTITKVFPGQPVQLGLRRKFGQSDEIYYFACYVFDPANTPATTNAIVQGDQWAYLSYPDGFAGGSTNAVGIYRVRYETSGFLIGTDSFEVRPLPEDESGNVQASSAMN